MFYQLLLPSLRISISRLRLDPRFHPSRSCVPLSLTREICQTGVIMRRVWEWEGGVWICPRVAHI